MSFLILLTAAHSDRLGAAFSLVERVDHHAVFRLKMIADIAHNERRRRIAVCSAGNHDLFIAAGDEVICVSDSLHRRGCIALDSVSRYFYRKFRFQPCIMPNVIRHSGGMRLPKHDLINSAGRNSSACEQLLKSRRRQIGRYEFFQTAARLTPRRADDVYNHDFFIFHVQSLLHCSKIEANPMPPPMHMVTMA